MAYGFAGRTAQEYLMLVENALTAASLSHSADVFSGCSFSYTQTPNLGERINEQPYISSDSALNGSHSSGIGSSANIVADITVYGDLSRALKDNSSSLDYLLQFTEDINTLCETEFITPNTSQKCVMVSQLLKSYITDYIELNYKLVDTYGNCVDGILGCGGENIVWNVSVAEDIRNGSERAIDNQIRNMTATSSRYEIKVSELREQARTEDNTSKNAMKTVLETDVNGVATSRQVADTTARDLAGRKRDELNRQTDLLEIAKTNIDRAIRTLDSEKVIISNKYNSITTTVTDADTGGASVIGDIKDEMNSLFNAVNILKNSFSATVDSSGISPTLELLYGFLQHGISGQQVTNAISEHNMLQRLCRELGLYSGGWLNIAEIEAIVLKPASDITDLEYRALAIAYTEIEDSQIEWFIGLFAEQMNTDRYTFDSVDIPGYGYNYIYSQRFPDYDLTQFADYQDGTFSLPGTMWIFNCEKLGRLHAELEQLIENNRNEHICAVNSNFREREYELRGIRYSYIERAALLAVIHTSTGETDGTEQMIRIIVGDDTGPGFQLVINEEDIDNKYLISYMSTDRYVVTRNGESDYYRIGNSCVETISVSSADSGHDIYSMFADASKTMMLEKYDFNMDAYMDSARRSLLIKSLTGLVVNGTVMKGAEIILGLIEMSYKAELAESKNIEIQGDINEIYTRAELGQFIDVLELEGVVVTVSSTNNIYGNSDSTEVYPLFRMSEVTESKLYLFCLATENNAFTLENFMFNPANAFEVFTEIRDIRAIKDIEDLQREIDINPDFPSTPEELSRLNRLRENLRNR